MTAPISSFPAQRGAAGGRWPAWMHRLLLHPGPPTSSAAPPHRPETFAHICCISPILAAAFYPNLLLFSPILAAAFHPYLLFFLATLSFCMRWDASTTSLLNPPCAARSPTTNRTRQKGNNGSFEGHFGTFVGHFWDIFGSFLGHFWVFFGSFLGLFWVVP